MDTNATRSLIEKFNAARANNDPDKIAELLADDVVWLMPIGFRKAGGGTVDGREDVVSGLTGGPGSIAASVLKMDTVSRTVKRLIVEGNSAVGFHLVAAELVKGGPYENEYVWCYTCEAGKIVRIEEFADTLYANNQMGGMPDL